MEGFKEEISAVDLGVVAKMNGLDLLLFVFLVGMPLLEGLNWRVWLGSLGKRRECEDV